MNNNCVRIKLSFREHAQELFFFFFKDEIIMKTNIKDKKFLTSLQDLQVEKAWYTAKIRNIPLQVAVP